MEQEQQEQQQTQTPTQTPEQQPAENNPVKNGRGGFTVASAVSWFLESAEGMAEYPAGFEWDMRSREQLRQGAGRVGVAALRAGSRDMRPGESFGEMWRRSALEAAEKVEAAEAEELAARPWLADGWGPGPWQNWRGPVMWTFTFLNGQGWRIGLHDVKVRIRPLLATVPVMRRRVFVGAVGKFGTLELWRGAWEVDAQGDRTGYGVLGEDGKRYRPERLLSMPLREVVETAQAAQWRAAEAGEAMATGDYPVEVFTLRMDEVTSLLGVVPGVPYAVMLRFTSTDESLPDIALKPTYPVAFEFKAQGVAVPPDAAAAPVAVLGVEYGADGAPSGGGSADGADGADGADRAT